MDYTWLQIYQMVTTLLFLWQLRVSMQQDLTNPATRTSSACFYEPDKALTLNCSQGHMVRLDDIYYGYTTSPRCEYWPGDCKMAMPGTEMYPCVGRRSCDINLPTGDRGRYMPKCGEYGTYVQADYACVAENDVHDVCGSNQQITGQFGYIKTPRYPNNYPDNMSCKTTIRTPYYNQKIKLYIIDLTLEEKNTDCADWLHIFDGHRAATFCGTRARTMAFPISLGNSLELEFHSDGAEQRKGFWLMYEAEPFIETTTKGPSTTTTLTTSTSAKPRDHTTTQSFSQTDSSTQPTELRPTNQTDIKETIIIYHRIPLSTGAVIGITVCLLLLLTVIILVVLVCKKKDNGHSRKLPTTLSYNSESAFLESATNNQISQMDFTNSEVFVKMCEEKGPNNIETAAAVASTSNDVYGDTLTLKSNNLHGDTLASSPARNLNKMNTGYTSNEYEC